MTTPYEAALKARVRARMAEDGVPIGTDNPTLLALGATPLLPLAERPPAIPKAALERERAKHPDRSSHFRSAPIDRNDDA